MASIGTFSGLASGIQWRDMIDQIMRLETTRKLTPVRARISSQELQREAWSDFRGLLDDLNDSVSGMRDGSLFGAFQVDVGKTAAGDTLLSASASSSAAPGTYSVEVLGLAKQEKVAAAAQSSTDEELGFSGTFQVNGRSVTVAATDTLATLRDKINAVNSGTSASGVTASIISVSATEHHLVLTADSGGSRGIELVDSASGGGVLADLGILTAGATADNTTSVSNGDGTFTTLYQSQRFGSSTTPVASMLGLTTPPATATIRVDGVAVSVDLENESVSQVLQNIKDALKAAGRTDAELERTGLVTEQVGSSSGYRLSTDFVVTDDGSAASQRALELLGFRKAGFADVRQAGADARIKLDGFELTRRSNTITDVVPGLTLDLQAAQIGSPVTVTVGRDTDAIVEEFEKFAEAFNAIQHFHDKQRESTSPLYANGALRMAVDSIKSELLNPVAGLPATNTFSRAAVVGVELTRDGLLEVDTEALKDALTTNFADVAQLFGTGATTTSSRLSFISDTEATVPDTYTVNITQAATVATATGSPWAGTYTGGADQMTVYDAFTDSSAVIALDATDTVDSVVAKLNAAFADQGLTQTASKGAGGELVITGSQYGSSASFTVSYQAGGVEYTGASGTGLAAGTYSGVDVAGTIDGVAATGDGRTLTGAAGTAAEGLSIMYSGTTTGAAGDVTYVKGLGGALEDLIEGYTDSVDGTIQRHMESLDTSIANLEQRALDVEDRLARHEEQMIRRFVAMEQAIMQFQSQGSWLASQIAGLASFSPGN